MRSSRWQFLQSTGSLLAAPSLDFTRDLSGDVAVIDGRVGGCAAALSAARNGSASS